MAEDVGGRFGSVFVQHGESGLWVSDLFPRLAKHVDSIAFLNSMHSKTGATWSGLLHDEYGVHVAWLSQHGLLGHLWLG